MKKFFSLMLVLVSMFAARASAQNPPGSTLNPYPDGYVAPVYSSCYSGDYVYCEQIRKRLDRQFQAENEWGSFKIKKIPMELAKRMQVFAKMADGQYKYVTGADTVNNWYEHEKPIPVDIQALEFVYVDAGRPIAVEWPILVPPGYVRDHQVQITLTENHFVNAIQADWLLHHRRVETKGGSFIEIVGDSTEGYSSKPALEKK